MTLDSSSPEFNLVSLPIRFIRKEILPVLTDLKLAIVLLLVIAVFSVSGTVIEQGQTPAFYQANYPEHPALFGFLSWKVIQVVGLDHVYRTWWFLSLLVLFGVSLTACTFTRQLPALKTAQKWQYYDEPRKFNKLALSAELNNVNLNSITALLKKSQYQIFQQEESNHLLYARKGIIGKMGPIVVHIGIVMILLGGIWGAMTGFMAQEMITSGDTFQVKNIIDAGAWSSQDVLKNWSVKVNRFWIDYTPKGGIDQFYSDLSVLNYQGEEVNHENIYVNKPLRYHGVVFYQTDWGIAAVKVKINNSPIFQLPMALLNTNGQGRLWGTWIPTKPDLSAGVSLLAKDLQGMVLIYDNEGKLVNTVRAGMSIPVNGVNLKILDVVGSTGLQIKYDPGIPIVYTGFALLMLGVVMSYFSHSQIWALQHGDVLYVGGKTNRAQVTFEREVLGILDQVAQTAKK
ncbi:cytochrome c biogenesis protein [Cylindrospermopsis raciborskii S07]|jgi:cytochrome c biogenesis protein|uniref:Cytochrome c biogenesis protein CcsB n=2 Tax=Cylindrospermopsis raciborskii TaxID=77022 RepID=A0A853MGF5_9CYAN|nr:MULTISPECIES: cytochrome c biogenesis protein [Cylindrospermopsis]MBU6345154.1 cytochrome c biogenesis protein [Cyanobacteria bacterium REEB494]KRH98126.1 cytochrome C biogenesis protein CcsB [Cylindrospermopsis sp. CR12]OBU77425.1 cytochrome C biogenesis protein CcsB [Cylindrospermopsis raciborskii CS-505]PNJ91290.1 cytochrome c biogenesis protein [Cylindrospermopsis raciborskii C04]PNJ95581.1 cytochrome c biogenesis protein [Cylindrospermopsis raciborskii C03]